MKRKIRHTGGDRAFYLFNTIFWIIFMFLIIYSDQIVTHGCTIDSRDMRKRQRKAADRISRCSSAEEF